MALTKDQIVTIINEEIGDSATLAGIITASEQARWFNEGQARLNRYYEKQAEVTWAMSVTEVALPADFVQISRLDLNANVPYQSFRVFGKNLIVDGPTGTTAAGTATLYYWAERPPVTDVQASIGSYAEDYAAIKYALHAFFRKVTSNRIQYNRYSTLLGANAVSMGDLQAEADRLMQDFVDARADLPPIQPAGFYGG